MYLNFTSIPVCSKLNKFVPKFKADQIDESVCGHGAMNLPILVYESHLKAKVSLEVISFNLSLSFQHGFPCSYQLRDEQ
jgi:hypothetical protein